MSIKKLESADIAQIAAGEVVERPASVVKELVENALDSGATQISVELKAGGISLIRVSDNGSGIADSETELAFERHATSKINSFQDLQSLTTLGFRGEALPSIAAVAQVQMVTSTRSESTGTYLSLDNGQVVQHEIQARSAGTTVTVQNLFRNVPARLKFLKSQTAEGSRIADIVSQYALARPEVKFTLINEGKQTLQTAGSGRLLDSVLAVYGLEIAQNMLEVKNANENWGEAAIPISVSGLAGSPRVTRSTRDYLSFFVNGRWISNRTLNFAVEEAYHGLLMQGKHPVAIINIGLPPSEIDVNVHPAKTEIKFRDERSVFSAVQKAVRQALMQSAPVPQIAESQPGFSIPDSPFTIPAASANAGIRPTFPVSQTQQAATPLITLPLLRVLGQLASNYIVAEGPDGLYLIDQHAAHERIMFEKIKAQRESRAIEKQGLLQAAAISVEPRQEGLMLEHLANLAEYGFEIEPFGERSFLVRSIPAVLKDKDWQTILREMLTQGGADWRESLAITLACHSAIRAGQSLSESEMREMIKQLEQCALPHSCPHGRPTIIQMTIQRLEKEFGRVQ